MKTFNLKHYLLATILLLLPVSSIAGLPDPGMSMTQGNTALVLTDPQNDFLSPEGVTWGVVGENVTANDTVAHIGQLLEAAKKNDIPVYVSPHYYFPTDGGWKFGGAVETMMHGINMFSRQGALSLEGFSGSGADWLEVYKPFIEDGKTIISSPHKSIRPGFQRSDPAIT